jgi:hypothetical protein
MRGVVSARIGGIVESAAEPAEAGTDTTADLGGVLADAAGEHQRVEPAAAAASEPSSRTMR